MVNQLSKKGWHCALDFNSFFIIQLLALCATDGGCTNCSCMTSVRAFVRFRGAVPCSNHRCGKTRRRRSSIGYFVCGGCRRWSNDCGCLLLTLILIAQGFVFWNYGCLSRRRVLRNGGVLLCASMWSPSCEKGVSFHNSPKDSKLKKKWIVKLAEGKRPTPSLTVCRKLFADSDFCYTHSMLHFLISFKPCFSASPVF